MLRVGSCHTVKLVIAKIGILNFLLYIQYNTNTIQFHLLQTIRIKTGRFQLTQPQLRPITWCGLIKF